VSSAHSHVLRHTRMCVAAQSSSGWCAERQIRLADHRNGEGTLEGETFAARVTMVFSRSVFRVFKCIHTRKGIFQLEGDTQVFFVECGYFGLSSRVIPRYREISRPVAHGYRSTTRGWKAAFAVCSIPPSDQINFFHWNLANPIYYQTPKLIGWRGSRGAGIF
jgi:hypothetical protein